MRENAASSNAAPMNDPEAPVPPDDAASAPAVASSPEQPHPVDLSLEVCAARLAELFPAVFTPGAPKPLKLRVQADIQQRAPGVFTRRSLSVFLHRHTTTNAYLRALVAAESRIDLDGQSAGEVSAEHRDAARAELDRRIAIRQARIAAEQDARREARREAQREARRESEREAQHAARQQAAAAAAAARAAEREAAEDDDKRRQAQALARAWATTTLTRANFLALKGLTDAELDAAIELANAAAARAPVDFARPAGPRPPHDARPTRPEGRRPRAPKA